MKIYKISLSLLVAAALAAPLATANAKEYHRSGKFETRAGTHGSYQLDAEHQHGQFAYDANVEVNHIGTWNHDVTGSRGHGEITRSISNSHNGRTSTIDESLTRTGKHSWLFDLSRTGIHGGTRSWSVKLNGW